MLRITCVEPATLKVEGRLRGPWVEELRRSWTVLSGRHAAGSLIVDLTDVTSIDSEGNKLLRNMSREGAKLRCGQLMKFILNQSERGHGKTDGMRKGG